MVERLVDQQMFGHTEYTALMDPLLIAELSTVTEPNSTANQIFAWVIRRRALPYNSENKCAWDL
jgi:hypothetical protein